MTRFLSAPACAFQTTCALLLLMTAPTTAADDFAGTYAGRQDSYEWIATIAKRRPVLCGPRPGRFDTPACMGEIEAIGRLQAGRIVTLSTDPDDACVLTISRTATGIDIKEKPGCRDHGAACSFDSRLKKVGK